ncbi:MAG TPA: amino acid adenylation domain-containing protein, partial [Pyrinomonadaceae bacterium]|nr:amino acid adenylation domain-containing protein [Pyrinomonadaceae bacterium]
MVDLLRWRATHQPNRVGYTFLANGEDEEISFTYAEMDRDARAIGGLLQSMAQPGDRALLLYPSGLKFISAFFGCLYSGLIAVPVYPPDPARLDLTLPRFRAIAGNARPSVALTTSAIFSRFKELIEQDRFFSSIRWIVTDEIENEFADAWRLPEIDSDTLAFLQYTSGSTSTPKGVMVSHGNLLHNEQTIQRACGHTHESTFAGWLPLYHDMGLIGNVLQPLYIGARCILMSPVAFLQRPFRWLHAISRFKAATSGGPNFAYDLCVRKTTPEQRASLDLSSWTVAFNGAEPVRLESLERFAKAFEVAGFRREAFYPCYGLAEATLIVSGGTKHALPVTYTVQAEALEHNRLIPVTTAEKGSRTLVGCGQVVGDQKIAIVEPESLKQCGPREVGEIWLSGPSVAQGYWQQPEQTEQTFNAYIAETGEGPFLRTGDLGCYANNELFVTGRLKDLIIIRGRNHYPQDIELTVERSHPALRPGCGAAFSVDVNGEERLVIVNEVEYREHPNLDDVIDKIRQAVFENHDLQPYAIVVVKSGRIPKTSSGKIQRHLCRAKFLEGTLDVLSESRAESPIEEEMPVANDLAPERTVEGIRAWLASQIAGKLGIKPSELDLDKPLVRYGLDSIAVIEHVHNIETVLGIGLPMVLLLQDASINQLIDEILMQLNALSPSANVASQTSTTEVGEYELSYGQKAMWFLNQMNPGPQGHITAAVKIDSELDVAALRRAFQELVNRHASLRTTFVSRQGEPFQIISESVDFDLSYHEALDWSEEYLDGRLAAEINRPFDLEHGPLLRVSLFKRSEQCHILLLVIHHIITDFWSLSVLLNELGVLYSSAKIGAPSSLVPLKLSYIDYVRRQNAALKINGEAHWQYWQRHLSGELPTLNLLTDHPRPPVQTFHGASQPFKLDAEITAALKSLSQAQGVTLYVTLLAAFQTLLFRYTHQEDSLVGSPTVGRNSADLADVVGYFVNPVVIRTDLSGNPSFATLIRRVRETVLDAFAHQDYPFALLVERLQPVRDPGFSPIFQTMFAMQKAHLLNEEGLSPFAIGESGRRLRLGDLELESFALRERMTQFDLTLLMAEADRELFASFEYNSDLFDAPTIARIAEHFKTLLRGIVANPQQALKSLPLLTEGEQQQLISDWNKTRVDNAEESFVHRLFEFQAELRPEVTAVTCEGEHVTYRELNARANRIAHRLRSLEVRPESVVGVLMDRSINFVVSLLGILKAGGAYLPLDPDYPRERLAHMLDNAGVTVLLTEEKFRAGMPERDVHVIELDTEWDSIVRESEENPETQIAGKNSAYVIYTSGSTGTAKGVQISHESLANLIFWHQREYSVTHTDRATLLAGISFDASVWELWPYLISGASIHLPDDETRNSPVLLRDWLVAHQISISFVPTPLAEGMLALDWPTHASLRVMLTGGDALRRYPSESIPFELVNHYGPTESTVVATSCRLRARDNVATAPPIGRPIANTNVYLLDSELQVVPVGVAGEIHIGGVGLARGYVNDPAQTAENFIPSPFTDDPGMRLYKTGDLARYLPDRNIEFLGRTDHQVKIRGFRVELGEIEVCLRQHSKVSDAVVMAQRNGHDENRLVAYVVTQGQTVKNSDLRQFLKQRLPHYMLPSVFVPLEEIPLTPNGKIDRKALPEATHNGIDTEFFAPRTPIEDVVAGIWANVLNVEQVGIHDNFFELGGHSLLATQIISRVLDYFKVKVPLHSLFENPTVAGMGQCIEDAIRDKLAVKSPPLLPVSRTGALPVSFAQQRLWFIDQLEPGNPAYNCPAAVSLSGALDVEALQKCFNYLVARHEALRTTFVAIDGLPHQLIAAPAP